MTELIVSHGVALSQKRKRVQQRYRIRRRRKNFLEIKRRKIVAKLIVSHDVAIIQKEEQCNEDNKVEQTKIVTEPIVSHDISLIQKEDQCNEDNKVEQAKIVTEPIVSHDATIIQKEDHVHEHAHQHQLVDYQRLCSPPECQVETECDSDTEMKSVTLTLTFQGAPVVSCQYDTLIQKEDEYKEVSDEVTTTTGLCDDAEDPDQFGDLQKNRKKKKRKRKRKLGSQVGKSQRRKKWRKRETKIKSAVHEVCIKGRSIQAVAAERGISERNLRRYVRKLEV